MNNYLDKIVYTNYFADIRIKIIYLRNIQLLKAYKKNNLTAIHVIKRSTDWQLWIMVSGGWY